MIRSVIGIDPGKEGAIVEFWEGEIESIHEMPLWETPHGESMVDGSEVYEILERLHAGNTGTLILIERQHPRPIDSKKSIMTLGRGYGAIETALLLLRRNYGIASQYLTPQEWKKVVLKGAGKKDKAATIGFVQARFPSVDLYRGKKDPHDGIADAVCIGLYGVMQSNGLR